MLILTTLPAMSRKKVLDRKKCGPPHCRVGHIAALARWRVAALAGLAGLARREVGQARRLR